MVLDVRVFFFAAGKSMRISILAALIMTFLFFSQLNQYLTVNEEVSMIG